MELTIPVPGGEIWADDSGGDGAPLVLVHGDWTDSRLWPPLTALLADRYRMIRYDLRGFGRSSRPDTPFTRLDDLRAVLDHRGVARASIVAHSAGGGPALCLALAEPERVTALVLVAPGAHDYPWPENDPYLREAARLIDAGDRERLVDLGVRTWAPAGADGGITGQFRGAVSSWFSIGDLERPDPPAFARLAELTVPAVVVVGDLEYPMVAGAGAAIAARIGGCRMVTVPGADHLLPLRAPAQLARVIAERVPA